VQTTLDGKYDKTKSLVVFDLHLTASGSEYTPSGGVVVTMKTPTGVTADTLLFHIKSDGTFEKLAFDLGDGTMVFTVSSFSTFVLGSAPAQIINLPWQSNETHHWHLVNNSAETDKAEHTFSAVEFVTEDGKQYDKRTCSVCAYVEKKEHGTAPNTYSIIYKENGATGGTVPSPQTGIENGKQGTISDNTGNLLKEGYTFDGWNTKSDGKGTTYKVGDTPYINDGNLVLFAKWKKTYVSSGVYFLMRGRRTVNEQPRIVSCLQKGDKGDEELFSWWDTNKYAYFFKDNGVVMTNSDVYIWGEHVQESAMPGYFTRKTFLKKNDADPSDYVQMNICGIAAKGNDFYLVRQETSDNKIILEKNGIEISSCDAEEATFAQEIALSGDKVIVAYSTSSTDKNTLHIACYDEKKDNWQEFSFEIASISPYTTMHICASASYIYVSGSFNETEHSGATTPSVLKIGIANGERTTVKTFGNQDGILGIVASETDVYILQQYKESEIFKVRVWKNATELYKVYEEAEPSYSNGQIQSIGTDVYIGLLLYDSGTKKNIYEVWKNNTKTMTLDVPKDYYLENFYVRP